MKKILITGICGTVGIELAKYYLDRGFYVIGIDINENEMVILEKSLKNKNLKLVPFDFASEDTINLIETEEPSLIIHGAVMKNTKYNEIYRNYYHKVNVRNTLKFIYSVLNFSFIKRFIFLSSDEAYNPINCFGKDKLEIEEIIKYINVKEIILQAIRFPFIIESKGSVYHIFRNQAKYNISLTVTHKDIKKIATSIEKFVYTWDKFDKTVYENGVFNFDIGEKISIYDLALNIIKDLDSTSRIVISGLREGEVLNRNIDKKNELKVYDTIFKIN